MSNKTQLQTNNTALDGYIARINAAKDVVASLPEAGGSGKMETCTVTFSNPAGTTIWYYLDANMILQTATGAKTVVALKNTIIAYNDSNYGSLSMSSNCTQLFGSVTMGAAIIHGDCQISFDSVGGGN